MKKRLSLLLCFCTLTAVHFLYAQQAPYLPPTSYTGTAVNYVRVWNASAPGQTPTSLTTGPLSDVTQSTHYYDAFGRMQQSIIKQASPMGNDVMTAHLYNSFGQEQYEFLPFVSTSAQGGDVINDGKFKSDAFMQEQAFYNGEMQDQQYELYQNGQHGQLNGPLGYYNWSYRQTDYEESPLNRVLDIYAPGISWVGSQGNSTKHNVTVQQLINTAADNVQMWNIAAAQGSIPTSGGVYAAGTLYKSISTDEQGNQIITYADMYGQKILEKVQNTATADNGSGSDHPGWLCTYYVFDDYGNLRFVIPSAAVAQIQGSSWSISQGIADELCYRFEYDALNRLIIKKTPGTPSGSAGEQWIVYDVHNRMVMTQDGNLRTGLPLHAGSPQWMCYTYDALDRPVQTGTISSSNSLSAMQASVTAQTSVTSSTTVSGTTGSAAQANITLSSASTTGVWQASQSIVLSPGFSSATTFTAMILSGTTTSTISTTTVNNNPLPFGLTLTPLTTTFYDNYNWLSTSGTSLTGTLNTTNINSNYFNTSYNASPIYAQPIVQSNQIQGLSTGIMAMSMDNNNQPLYGLRIFDEMGKMIQQQTLNTTGGIDITTYQYDFTGRNIRKLVAHAKNGTNAQTHLVSTVMNYDAMGRLQNITKSILSQVGSTTLDYTAMPILANQYDERGMVKQTILGNNMETQQFDYNMRGWPLGVNRDFAKTAGTGSNYFGYDLGYDYGSIVSSQSSSAIGSYANPSFTGSIAGLVWKSKGDNQIRKYDYTYDLPNRLLGADFNQFDGSQFDKTAGIDYSVSNLSYDANGNIGSMKQNGWIMGGSQTIDELSYNYFANTNRLQYVADNSAYNQSNPASTLGDFHYAGTKSAGSTDYTYDNNGNAISDVNRTISSISYNYLNLPYIITLANGKGTIEFDYDAAGNKLRKITKETNGSVTYNGTAYTTSITTTTTYIGDFVYQTLVYGNAALSSLQYTDNLLYLGHEEGRIRTLYANASTPNVPTGYAFDYFIRDHLNNVRLVLTNEQWADTYPAATLETATISSEENYYSITNDASHVIDMATNASTSGWWGSVTDNSYENSNPPVPNPGDPDSTQNSVQMYRLNGATGDRFGLGITLKVMAGDQVSIFGKSVWHNSGATPNPYPLTAVLSNLLTAFAGTSAVAASRFDATGPALSGSGMTTSPLSSLLTNTPSQPDPTVAPKAAINWILFNDQFVPVSMGTDLVSSTGDIVKTHSQLNLPMTANGYLYVYCSNESDIDVFFDNLQVVHTRGPILQEDHYYPMGLQMAGLDDHAWNRVLNPYHYQGKERQNHEFSDGTGLMLDDFGARYYDPQLGRWHAQDPAGQNASPYAGMANNWPNSIDPTGALSFWSAVGDIGLIVAGATAAYFTAGISLGLTAQIIAASAVAIGGYGAGVIEGKNWSPFKWNNDTWKAIVTGEIVAASAFVGGEEISGGIALGSTAPYLSQLTTGIANGVGTSIFSSEVSSLETSNALSWSWDKMFQTTVNAVVSGAVSASTTALSNLASPVATGTTENWVAKGIRGLVSGEVGTVLTTGFKEELSLKSLNDWSIGHFFDGSNQWPALASGAASKIAGSLIDKYDPLSGVNSQEGKVGAYFVNKLGTGAISTFVTDRAQGVLSTSNIFKSIFNGTFFWTQFTGTWSHFATSPPSAANPTPPPSAQSTQPH